MNLKKLTCMVMSLVILGSLQIASAEAKNTESPEENQKQVLVCQGIENTAQSKITTYECTIGKNNTTTTLSCPDMAGLTYQSTTVRDSSNNIVLGTVREDNTYTVVLDKGIYSVIVVYKKTDTFKFKDVPTDSWYFSAISDISNRKIMQGVDETHFCPEGSMTRAMTAVVLYNLEGDPTVENKQVFSDVPVDSYYSKAITWAFQNSLINGIGNNQFLPEKSITREQFFSILRRYIQYKKMSFAPTQLNEDITSYYDEKMVSDYAKPAMNWAITNGILQGYQKFLKPKEVITRAQGVVILQRVLKRENMA